jgi:hypothetical protein
VITFFFIKEGSVLMEVSSIWSGLGSSVVGPDEETKKDIDELKHLIQQVQAEILGSVEALNRRIALLEKLVESKETVDAVLDPNDFTENALMFMSQKELGIDESSSWPEPDLDAPAPRVVSGGFVAPPPDEEVMVEEQEDDFDEIEFSHEDHGRGDPVMWANRTLRYIGEKGGVVNQYLKRFDLVPDDITKDERAEFKSCLADLGVQTYIVNQIRHFYFVGEEEEGESQYSTVYSS